MGDIDPSQGAHERFQTVTAVTPATDPSEVWRLVRPLPGAVRGDGRREQPMESGVSVLAELEHAPPRTLHVASLVRSSPLSSPVRAMLEAREMGRRFDAVPMDLGRAASRLPGLHCPAGPLEFLADESSFESLCSSIECLLQHRKRLVAASIDSAVPRRHVLILGAGPGGLMAAIQLRLRDHEVVVCELREVYTRNRFIGVYKEVAHLMAALGMPERMTYDFSHYRGKRGIMLADIQTLLHAVALKLGAVIYTGALARDAGREALASGEIELHRSTRGGGDGGAGAIGMTRWHHDSISRVRSGVAIRFDTIVEATGGRSGVRELLVDRDNVVSMRTFGAMAAERDPTLKSFFDDPEDHCAEFVESDYGCPAGLLQRFASVLLSGGGDIPDELPCFVSNIDASILTRPIRATDRAAGVAARIGDAELAIPDDRVVVECPRTDQTLTRYQIEGPLPLTFEYGGTRVSTRAVLDTFNPVSLLLRILYAMGVPFEAVDRRRLVEFYTLESSRGDASDIVATWVGAFRTLRMGGPTPIWCGQVPGSATVSYAIVGEALQNAWYRFGVGVDDTFNAAIRFAEGIDMPADRRLAQALRLERVMTSRCVQVLYHLYAVTRNVDQGVVGPVLTERYMDEQHGADLAEARLREVCAQGADMLAASRDVAGDGSAPSLLEVALAHQIDACCRRALKLLESARACDPELLRRVSRPRGGGGDWRAGVLDSLEPALAARHREIVAPLFEAAPPGAPASDRSRARPERLVELALGRYAWATPWIRACALRELDPRDAAARAALEHAAVEHDVVVAETAAGALQAEASRDARLLTVDKVEILAKVGLFQVVPHEALAGVARLLTDVRAGAGQRVFDKGDHGDALYVIASGSVRVHDGDRTLRTLGRHQHFGELSLLDAEPRSASVTALEATLLLRLGQDDFYALVAERPEIVHAVNRVLCRMLRS